MVISVILYVLLFFFIVNEGHVKLFGLLPKPRPRSEAVESFSGIIEYFSPVLFLTVLSLILVFILSVGSFTGKGSLAGR